MLERKAYNNDDKIFFSVLTFVKPPSYDAVLQHTRARQTLIYGNMREIMFYPLIKHYTMLSSLQHTNQRVENTFTEKHIWVKARNIQTN